MKQVRNCYAEVLSIFRELHHSRIAVIMVTHEPEVAKHKREERKTLKIRTSSPQPQFPVLLY